jgi:transcriptional regulator with XRE-family HTH domain
MHLREKLRAARIQRAMTTEDVAAKVGRSQSLVSRWELGTAKMPDWDMVMKWADAVGVSVRVEVASSADSFEHLRQIMTPEEVARLVQALTVVKKVS